jgi:hypothetical protein
LEEQLKARNTRKFAKLSQGVDQDTQTTSWVSCCKNSLNNLWVLYCWRTQQRNNNAWRGVHEGSNTSKCSKIHCHSCLK